MITNKEERIKFIKKIIFWSVVTGGVIALFLPLVSTGSVNVLAAIDCSLDGGEADCMAQCINDIPCANNCMNTNCPTSNPPTNITITPIDPCSIGPCFNNISLTTQGLQGNWTLIFGFVNNAILLGVALAFGALVVGGGQIMIGKEKEGRSTVWYASIALAILISVYIGVGIVVNLVSFINNILFSNSGGPSPTP